MITLPAALIAAALASASPPLPQPVGPPEPIVLGSSFTLSSKPLGENRTVNVVLPPAYGKDPAKRYPVLYLLDGGVDQDLLNIAAVAQNGGLWGRSADAIIVGIATKDRRKELTGPTSDPELLKKYPTAGSSAAFRAFIRDEVKPFVERSYRTNGRDAVVGESLAGLFIVETYMTEPGLFDTYGAIDPSLWWDKEKLSKTAGKIGAAQKAHPLYLAIAKEQAEEPAAVNRILARVPAAKESLCFNKRADLTHATIYQQLAPQMLQFLLPAAEPAPPEFGFEVPCSPRF
ncbi:MAG TPA: alpha/beta hydrolase-fold protein [Sphingomicrobium sp.]